MHGTGETTSQALFWASCYNKDLELLELLEHVQKRGMKLIKEQGNKNYEEKM